MFLPLVARRRSWQGRRGYCHLFVLRLFLPAPSKGVILGLPVRRHIMSDILAMCGMLVERANFVAVIPLADHALALTN